MTLAVSKIMLQLLGAFVSYVACACMCLRVSLFLLSLAKDVT